MKIKIEPVILWSTEGTIEANYIKFLPSIYSFSVEDLNVNYQLLNGIPNEDDSDITYTYVSGGACLVPSEEVAKWENDSQIFDYIISTLKLTKV